MGLTRYKLGELICQTDERNTSGKLSLTDVKGISTDKAFIETKANMDGVSLDSYKVVNSNEFSYVPDTSRRGDKIALAYNDSDQPVLISSIYTTFKCNRLDLLIPEYLFMYFNRPEFDRYSRFNSWGSARETFSWEDFCDIDIILPDIERQSKFVSIYTAMNENLAAYKSKIDDLKTVCDGYIEDLRRKMKCEKIGAYISRSSEKNSDKAIIDVVGLSTEKTFRIAQSRVNRDELGGYKIVHPLDIAYVPTTDTWKVLAFAVNHFEKDVVVSPIYEVFSCHGKLKSDYLAIWLKRGEFDRYARYNSWGSARENFPFEEMREVQIPIPDESVQQAIIDIYMAYEERKSIVSQLKDQLKNLCPILIKGSLETAN